MSCGAFRRETAPDQRVSTVIVCNNDLPSTGGGMGGMPTYKGSSA